MHANFHYHCSLRGQKLLSPWYNWRNEARKDATSHSVIYSKDEERSESKYNLEVLVLQKRKFTY